MVAETSFRKQGIGRAATCTMLMYGAKSLNISRFFCKINENNTASLEMFKSLGFVQCSYAACFKEVELELMSEALNDGNSTVASHGKYKTVPCPSES